MNRCLEASVDERLTQYYQSSIRYRDDLKTHGRSFLEPFLILVKRYVKQNAQILDLGCGTGLSTRLLNESGYCALGLDLSPLFLSVEKQENSQTDLIAGNAFQLPFPDRIFDAVVAFEFIEHVSDIPRLLDEILRVLKDGGHILFHSPNLLSPYLPAFDLLRLLIGREGRPVFAENLPQAFRWLLFNLTMSLRKRITGKPSFQYREPDLSERRIGGDSDSVYLANPQDLARYLRKKGCVIINRAHAMSRKNKILAALTPNFAPYMGLVAYKHFPGE